MVKLYLLLLAITMSPSLLLMLDLLTPLEGMPGLLIGTGSRSAMLA